MLLLIPIFEVEDDETNFLLPNEVEQEGFLKAFITVQEAEEYIFRKGYTQNVNSTCDIDEPYAYYKGEHNEFSARIMSGGTPTHGKW